MNILLSIKVKILVLIKRYIAPLNYIDNWV